MSAPLHILHLEDVPEDSELVKAVIEDAGLLCTVRRVENEADFRAALERGDIDIILADYSLPSFDGMAALKIAHARRPDTPFLFVTGALRDDSAVETLRKGATDFIVKQRLERLVPAIQRALREAHQRTQREKAQATLRYLLEASSALATSFDYDSTLRVATELPLPRLGDCCLLYLLSGEGLLTQVSAAATTPSHEARLRHSPPGPMAAVKRVVRTGRAEMVSVETLPAPDSAALELLKRLQARSALVAPLVARNGVLGAMTVAVVGDSGRQQGEDELHLMEEIARRAGFAIDNARMHRELRQAVQAREDLLAIVSHDLRNPLSAIITNTALLRRNDSSPPEALSRKFVEAIARSADRMNRLIADLLDLAKLSSGTMVLHRERRSVPDILREMVDTMEPMASLKRITITVDAPPAPLFAHCDHDRVLRILTNLVGNAIKFSPEGGTVSVRVCNEGHEVKFVVSDQGPGIAPENLPFVFDRYWQATHASSGGIGLGLSIAKALVEEHGGSIEATSHPGRGATLAFTLPVEAPASGGRQVPVKERFAVPVEPSVLVVDDDADIRLTLAQILSDSGYRVATAANGSEALELLRNSDAANRPSVILLDVMMPVMDGTQFREEQRRDPALGNIPVIVVSAAGGARTVQAEAYLKKPLRRDELLEVVRRWTEQRSAQDEEQSQHG